MLPFMVVIVSSLNISRTLELMSENNIFRLKTEDKNVFQALAYLLETT